jgi:hypothetical protein
VTIPQKVTGKFKRRYSKDDGEKYGDAAELAVQKALFERYGITTERFPFGKCGPDLIVTRTPPESEWILGDIIEISCRAKVEGGRWPFRDFRLEERKHHFWQPDEMLSEEQKERYKQDPYTPHHLIIVSNPEFGPVTMHFFHNTDLINNIHNTGYVIHSDCEDGEKELNAFLPIGLELLGECV